MNAEWPKKKESYKGKDCICHASYYGECSCGAAWADNDEWNACRDAFMKVIEEKPLRYLYKEEGISKSQPQLIPLDYDRDLKQLFDDVYNRKIINHSELKAKCSTFGQSKEKLVPLNEKELADWISTSEWDNISSADIAKQLCAKFGIPPQREEVSVDEIEQILIDANKKHNQIRIDHKPVTLYFNYLAKAIFDRIKGGK